MKLGGRTERTNGVAPVLRAISEPLAGVTLLVKRIYNVGKKMVWNYKQAGEVAPMTYPRRPSARSTCDSCRVPRGALTIGKSFLLVGVFLALAAQAGSQSPRVAEKPWVTKDWREWSRKECEQVLQRSPWATTRTVNYPDTSYYQVYTAQFRSALPIRHALVRLKQIEKRYDKMNAKQREAFDKKMEAELGGDFENRIVVRLSSRWRGDFRSEEFPIGRQPLSVANTAALMLPNGRLVLATGFRADGDDLEAVFPRVVDGEPVIRPEDKVVVFMVGKAAKPVFDSYGFPYFFRVDEMVYRGRLEF